MIAQQQQQWFFSSGGERVGPVGFDYLLEMAKTGKLDPRNDMVWSTSLSDWEPAGEVEGLFERRSVRREDNPLDSSNSMANAGSYENTAPIPKGHFPGTGRLGFLMGLVVVPALLGIGWQFVFPQLQKYTPPELAGYLPVVVFPLMALLMVATVLKRFKNLGMSGWWLVGLLVPFLNLWLGYRCVACPGGYATAKKLDGMGKLAAFLYWAGAAAGIALPIAGMVGMLGEMKESGMINEVTKQFEELRKSALPGK